MCTSELFGLSAHSDRSLFHAWQVTPGAICCIVVGTEASGGAGRDADPSVRNHANPIEPFKRLEAWKSCVGRNPNAVHSLRRGPLTLDPRRELQDLYNTGPRSRLYSLYSDPALPHCAA
eukprot:7970929-Pyramimonas_sp.AAC.2